jgi:hypothetical protein
MFGRKGKRRDEENKERRKSKREGRERMKQIREGRKKAGRIFSKLNLAISLTES